MPELPEVETVARSVDQRVRGRRIASVWLGAKAEPFRSSPAEIVAVLTGNTILCAHRVGKHIVVDLAGQRKHARLGARQKNAGQESPVQAQWLVHLGMTGQLRVCSAEEPLAAHTHAIVQLDDNRELRFVDPRRFGRLSVIDLTERQDGRNRGSAHPFTGPGAEPLDVSSDAFRALFRGRRTPIKSALLNQSLLQGVGNIYADESLFHAGIRPRRHAGRLKATELDRLRLALQQVLRRAIAAGGSSVSDYVDATGAKGFFQVEHHVYMRTGQPCHVCKTPIQRIMLGGRGTHFCPVCQR